jgi:hypothetical protein
MLSKALKSALFFDQRKIVPFHARRKSQLAEKP